MGFQIESPALASVSGRTLSSPSRKSFSKSFVGSSMAYGPATSHSLMVKYSSGRLPASGSPEGLRAWHLISVVSPLTRRLHSIGGVAPGNRPVQSPRQPTGPSGVGLKSSDPKDRLIGPSL